MAVPDDRPATAKRTAVQASILTALEELLGEGASYADVGVERLATRAGISRTAFYFYFRDKREVLLHLTREILNLLYEQADRWYSGHGDPTEEIREALTNIVVLYREHGALLRAIVELSAYDDEVGTFWRALLDRFVVATEERIRSAQAAGDAGPMPARATAFALVWMTERVCYEALVHATPPPQHELVDGLVGIWVRSVYGG